MTGQQGTKVGDRKVLGFYDASRAHWHSPAKRKMYVTVVREDKSIRAGIARLLKEMYRGRDVGNCLDDFSEKVMKELDFQPGVVQLRLL